MLKIKKILAPVDFSERSEHAVEHANAVADRFDAALVLAHIIPPSPYEYAAFDEGFYAAANWPTLDQVREGFERQMSALVAKVPAGRTVETILRRGDPAHEVVKIVKESQIDLVVMPTHGYGPFRRFVLGSVTSKALHDLACPVLTGTHVPHLEPINTEPYKRIACAIDLGPSSEKVLIWAHELSKACADDLIVIHAAPRVEVGGTYGDWFPPETTDQITKHGKEQVDALLAKLDIKAEVHVASAEPVYYTSKTADEAYADLLVIGRSSHEGLLGRLQQHALDMIREAPCPVISV